MLLYIMINMYMLNCINKYLFVYIYIITGYINHIITDNIYIYTQISEDVCFKKSLDQFQRLIFKRT